MGSGRGPALAGPRPVRLPLRVRVAAVVLLPAWAHRRVIRRTLGGLVLAALLAAVLVPGHGSYGCGPAPPGPGQPVAADLPARPAAREGPAVAVGRGHFGRRSNDRLARLAAQHPQGPAR